MTWLARVAGIEGASVAARNAALPILEAQAGFFLAAGGSVTPDLWAELDVDERAAFVGAGQKLDAERALLLASALRGQTSEHARRIGGERGRAREILVAEAVTQ